MKKIVLTFMFLIGYVSSYSQSGYEIKINLKNCKDTLAYLTYYQFDKTLIKDTCTHIKNGKIIFKGKEKLDTGMYSLVSQQKSIYFDFFIDENSQQLELKSDAELNYTKDLMAINSKNHNDFFNYFKFIQDQGEKFEMIKAKTKGLTKKDSIRFVEPKYKDFSDQIHAYEEQFILDHKGSYISEVLNLKAERYLKDIPKASNGRPDSVKVYNYYKNHYWDNVNFGNDAICRTPFFANKLNRYFDQILVKHPDTLTVEINKILDKTKQGSTLNKILIAHFAMTYENPKVMGFDRVFVNLVDRYFKTGKASGIYEDEDVVKKIIKKSDKLKPLLLGEVAPDLSMILDKDRDKIAPLGFEKINSSEEATNLFYKHLPVIEKTFFKLHSVKAEYLILVFWDVDCGHCQTEIPKLLTAYHEMQKEGKDVKVVAVYTQKEYDKYFKYLKEKNLDWINVYDGVHYNNLADKYDVVSTPVIYILDKNKVIKAKKIGAEQVKEVVTIMEKENSATKK